MKKVFAIIALAAFVGGTSVALAGVEGNEVKTETRKDDDKKKDEKKKKKSCSKSCCSKSKEASSCGSKSENTPK
jgi:hypothetical protein